MMFNEELSTSYQPLQQVETVEGFMILTDYLPVQESCLIEIEESNEIETQNEKKPLFFYVQFPLNIYKGPEQNNFLQIEKEEVVKEEIILEKAILFIAIKGRNDTVKALVDTGANKFFIRKDIVPLEYPKHEKQTSFTTGPGQWHSTTAVTIPFQMHQLTSHRLAIATFHVVDELTYPIVIELDILFQLGFILNCDKRTLTWDGLEISMTKIHDSNTAVDFFRY